MVSHKIYFYGEILIIIPKLSLLPLLIWSTESGENGCQKQATHCYILLLAGTGFSSLSRFKLLADLNCTSFKAGICNIVTFLQLSSNFQFNFLEVLLPLLLAFPHVCTVSMCFRTAAKQR